MYIFYSTLPNFRVDIESSQIIGLSLANITTTKQKP